MKSYIYDTFDFYDSPEQSIGVWDYINMNFDILYSVKEMAYKHKTVTNFLVNFSLSTKRAEDKIYVYNSNYVDYKKTVSKGLDYRIFSDSFIEFKDEHFSVDLIADINGEVCKIKKYIPHF